MAGRIERREFLRGAACCAVAALLDGCRMAERPRFVANGELRAMLMHLGWNMWSDVPVESWGTSKTQAELDSICAADHVRTDFGVWRRVTERMSAAGCNAIVIDLGEACVYPSHPELAVRGSLDPEAMRAELARLRGLGLEPIPKLNFSAAHDVWLKDYHRQLSTAAYYRVCADVIRDVAEIFGHPRLLHLGYDEETAGNQCKFGYCAIRQGELWWHDFLWFVDITEKAGMRPWIWSDSIWRHKEAFLKRMPRSVLQSNWYYGSTFDVAMAEKYAKANPKDWWHDGARTWIGAYEELEKAGFDQVPTGSSVGNDENIGETVAYARRHIDAKRLKGFLMAPWDFPSEPFEKRLLKACDLVETAWKR